MCCIIIVAHHLGPHIITAKAEYNISSASCRRFEVRGSSATHSMPATAAAQSCSLIIFGLTVAAVLDDASEERNLDVIELWSGVGAIVSAAIAAGRAAQGFDKYRIPGVTDTTDPNTTEDILLEAGFRKALELVMRVRVGGLVWMAPVCSSWIFLNLKNTKRNKVHGPRFSGNLAYAPVRDGNRMAEMAAFLFAVAVLRGVHAVIENPPGSMIFGYEPAATVWETIWRTRFWAVLPHCRFSEKPFGSRFGKKFKLMGSHRWVRRLACKCKCPGRKHKLLVTTKMIKGVRKVTGSKQALKESAAYPAKLGIAVINAWKSSGEDDEVIEGPGPTGPRSTGRRSTGARSTGRRSQQHTQKGRCQRAKKSWATLDLEETRTTSSSSRCAAHASRTSCSSTRASADWSVLRLDDDGAGTVVSQCSSGWRALPLDDVLDGPGSQVGSSWQTLSIDD